jgi:hypothetical protein
MALDRGTSWAIYLLMGTHADTVDGKSEYRNAVEKHIGEGLMPKAAMVKSAQDLFGADISDIGNLPDLSVASLRNALPIAYTGAGCPQGQNLKDVFGGLSGNLG